MNINFPIWLLYIMPTFLPIMCLISFAIISLVIVLSFKAMDKKPVSTYYRGCMLKAWICTYIAKIIGSLLMLSTVLLDLLLPKNSAVAKFVYDNITNYVAFNPLANPYALAWAIACLAISGVLIYVLNMRFSFNSLEITHGAKKRVSLALCLFSSPYIFLIPTVFLYKM